MAEGLVEVVRRAAAEVGARLDDHQAAHVAAAAAAYHDTVASVTYTVRAPAEVDAVMHWLCRDLVQNLIEHALGQVAPARREIRRARFDATGSMVASGDPIPAAEWEAIAAARPPGGWWYGYEVRLTCPARRLAGPPREGAEGQQPW